MAREFAYTYVWASPYVHRSIFNLLVLLMGPFCVPVPGLAAFDFLVFIPSFLGTSESSHGRAKKLRAIEAQEIPAKIHTSLSPRYPL